MRFKESKTLLELVNKSQNFVLLCHEGPDEDSLISCLVTQKVLEKMGKQADIFSVDEIGIQYRYLDADNRIKVAETNNIDYSVYDVFFALDVNTITRLGIKKDIGFGGKIVNIDHHEGDGCGDINLIDGMAGATCALLYYLFRDWSVQLDKDLLDLILIAIVADSGVFQYPVSAEVFRTVAELLDNGGDYVNTIYRINQNYDLMVLKFWSEVIDRIQIDSEHRFAFVIIPYEVTNKYENYGVRSRQVADTYLRSIKGTDFGIVIMEEKDGTAKISIRTRTPGYYVADLVTSLGGGGHLTGGGVSLKAGTFNEACEKVLIHCRDYSKRKSEISS